MKINNIKKIQKKGVVGFTASTFDLLHPGHIDMLSQAAERCDYLIVGLLSNPQISRPESKMAPVESIFERWMRLQAVSCIDEIIPFDTEEDLENMLKILKPDIRFVGDEYKDKEHTGKDIKGIRIYYNERRHNYSSTKLKNKLNKYEE